MMCFLFFSYCRPALANKPDCADVNVNQPIIGLVCLNVFLSVSACVALNPLQESVGRVVAAVQPWKCSGISISASVRNFCKFASLAKKSQKSQIACNTQSAHTLGSEGA